MNAGKVTRETGVSRYVALMRPPFMLPLGLDGGLERLSYTLARKTSLRVISGPMRMNALRSIEGIWGLAADRAMQALKGPMFALTSSSRNPEKSVADAALALWLSRQCGFALQPKLSYERIRDHEVLRTFNSNETVLLGDEEAHYSAHDIQTADRIARALETSSGAIEVAATFFMLAANTWSWQVQFLLRWMALEALFGTDEKMELSFRLRQNISLFHAKSEAEAVALFSSLGKWYSTRSSLSHGAGLKLADEEARGFRTFVVAVFRRVLSSAPMRERFSSNEKRKKFLAALAFSRRKWSAR